MATQSARTQQPPPAQRQPPPPPAQRQPPPQPSAQRQPPPQPPAQRQPPPPPPIQRLPPIQQPPPTRVESGISLDDLCKRTKTFIAMYWGACIILLWPIVLLPIIIQEDTPARRCAYVILLMAMFWMTECLPMAITAVLPMVLFPCLGILDSKEVSSCYMNDTIMVFVGGLIVAIAIEHSNLHMRLAITTMRIVGCSHRRLLGGLCTVTMLISMWISNTAATAMMLPIIFAILQELEKEGLGKVFNEEGVDPEDPAGGPILRPTDLTKAYLLATAYTATFGGTGTLVGTGTNLTFKGIYEETFPQAPGITFAQWTTWAFLPMIVNSFLTWLYVQVFYLGCMRPNSQAARMASIGEIGEGIANQVMRQKYDNLGPMTFHEAAVGILFTLCVCLWVFRAPGFITGWARYLTTISIRDSAPVLFVTILMFCIPKDPNFIHSCNKDAAKRPVVSSEGLITWKVINAKMPWSLMFLLGGGFAISKGSDRSCLSTRIGESLIPLKEFPPLVILSVICAFTGSITDFTSNIGIANIILPVVAQMCIAIEQHPMYLMVPTTFMCSHSFRLPVGTPPNAIAAAVGHIPVKSLIAGGCIPAIYSLASLIVLFPTWGVYVYNLQEFPEWARNMTTATSGRC